MRHVRYKDSLSPEKTTYQKDIFGGSFDKMPTWKDIKNIEFQDDDTIQSSWDDDTECYFVLVSRWIEETDEEHQERLQYLNESDDRAKEKRRQHYLKLKAEFENE